MCKYLLKLIVNNFCIVYYCVIKVIFLFLIWKDKMKMMDRKEIVEGCMKNFLYSMVYIFLNSC